MRGRTPSLSRPRRTCGAVRSRDRRESCAWRAGGAFAVVADRLLGVRRQRVHHLANPGLATPHGLALRHTRGRHDLWRHALDLLDTAAVVTNIDHGLLFSHRRLVLLLGPA